MSTILRVVGVLAVVLWAGQAVGAVVDSSPYGFSTADTLVIGAPAGRVFEAVTRDVGSWWDKSHTFSGNSTNLYIEPEPGGCFCERLENGAVRHMSVVYVDFGKKLRFTGGLGPLQGLGLSGSMTLDFTDTGGKTTLVMTYNVGGYARGGLGNWAPVVDGVLSAQIERLKNFVETGSPEPRKG
jgi:uncharacterized protein YndB with AHSA1/START domain